MDLRLLRRRLLTVALVLGVCIAGTSLTLFQRAQHASAATAPYFTLSVGGQTYLAQYAGNAYSNQNSSSIYSDFGQWNEYSVDSYGTWHWFGQFSGNEDVYYDSHGQIVGGMNVNVPGIGNVNTYSHDQVFNPPLLNPPAGYNYGKEALLGERFSGAYSNGQYYYDCEIDEANFTGAPNTGATSQFFSTAGQASASACAAGNNWFLDGDSHITSFYNQFQQSAAMPHANGPVVASLHRQHSIPLPVTLSIAGGVIFLGAIVSGAICSFASCSKPVKLTLAAVALGLGIISTTMGISASIITSLRTYAATSATLVPAITEEAAGTVEMAGVISGQTAAASTEAGAIVNTPLTRSYSYP
ncbi:MAG: hypothetical protein PVS3B1_36380 [Ktedonobacteraceae bacterium]